MKKIIILATLGLMGQVALAGGISSVSSLSCTGRSSSIQAQYDQSSQTLTVSKDGETKSYEMSKASGGGPDLDLVLNGSSAKDGEVQMNISSSGTAMIYQISSGEIDYLKCN